MSDKYNQEIGAFLDRYLDQYHEAVRGRGPAPVSRLRRHHGRPQEALRLAVGDRIHYPSLAPIEFFDRADFPWLGRLRGRDRRDPRRVPRGPRAPRRGSRPTSPTRTTCRSTSSPNSTIRRAGAPSTCYKMGQRVEDNAASARGRWRLLEQRPQPDQPGRTPAPMFSLLKPKTRIPRAHRRHQRAPRHAPAADRPGGLRLPRRQRRTRNGFRARPGSSTTRSSTRPGTTATSCASCSSSTSGTRSSRRPSGR